ncbi:MAG TPA: class I adenylate-forming enzyme family protein [Acidimicrobiales bacterium]|nr:class I adenylate-forming enzyme family protein [Acidimicrobiales bacterium]
MPPTGELSIEVGVPLLASPPDDETLGGFLVEAAARFGPRTALVTEGGRWSYAELLDSAMTVARSLLARAVRPGTRVGVLMPNGAAWIAATYGAALVGAVPVLLNVFSSVPEQEAALTLTEAKVLLMTGAVGGRSLLQGLVARNPRLTGDAAALPDDRLPHLEQLFVEGTAEPIGRVQSWTDLLAGGAQVSDDDVTAARRSVDPGDDAVIMFTSGTSGIPKAVVHGHRAPRLQPSVWARMQLIRTDERVFSTYPFCWSSGFARSLGATLSMGACMVTVDHFDPAEALRLMQRERVTMAILPGQGHLDLRLVEHPDFPKADLSSLERPSNPTLAKALGLGDGWHATGYGLTETFTLVTACPADGSDGEPPGSSGRTLPGWTVKVTDPDSGDLLPRGQTGQFKVKGPAVMKRYHGRPAGSGFDNDGFFVTPDLGYIDDAGFLFFVSRIDDVVRSAGINVSTSELEREIAELDGVRLAVALGIPHPTLGQALVACIVAERAGMRSEDVLEWLRPRIASYKLPRAVLFFDESELKYTVSQKVQRADLRELAVERIKDLGLW